MAYWRWPGSKPWMQTTVALTQTADWDEGMAAGILKYDDGTIWYWQCEMAHPAAESYTWWWRVNEVVPGQAWEQLSPDTWTDVDVNAMLVNGDTGLLVDGAGLYSQKYVVAHDGGDKSFWFDYQSAWNTESRLNVFIVSKESRSWEMKVLDGDVSLGTFFYIASTPVIWDGYVWWLEHKHDTIDGDYHIDNRLSRMSVEAPYTVVTVKEWSNVYSTGDDPTVVNPSTGLPLWFDSPAQRPYSAELAAGIGDGYFYCMGDYGYNMSALWRMRLPDGEWEVVYYHQWDGYGTSSTFGSYNLPGGVSNDKWHGPLPIGVGFISTWDMPRLGFRDGWMYFANNLGGFNMLSQGWYGGPAFCRMELAKLGGSPVAHSPEDPIFEIISMTTGAEESYYNWDDTEYWGGYWKSHGGYGWKDGIDSCHAFFEGSWVFDNDGSILFLHHEYPNWYMEPGGYYPPYVMSRLSPPEAIPITFNLVFEGEEMKGYGHAREVPAKTRIGTIELSGE